VLMFWVSFPTRKSAHVRGELPNVDALPFAVSWFFADSIFLNQGTCALMFRSLLAWRRVLMFEGPSTLQQMEKVPAC